MGLSITFTKGRKIYHIDGKEVTQEEADRRYPSKPFEGMPRTLFSTLENWASENNGKGRYISQLADKGPGRDDPNAYCRSQREAIDKAKVAGFQTIEKS
jgi:hypothetical protein